MSTHPTKTPGEPNLESEAPEQLETHEPGNFDEEIHLGGVIWTLVGVAALTVICYALMWGMLVGMRSWAAKHDPSPSPIPEANEMRLPPSPRLQVEGSFAASEPHHRGEKADYEEMREMRWHEDQMLGHAGWNDPARQSLRVPIDVAIDVVARRGVGSETLGVAPQAPAAPAVPVVTPAPAGTPVPAGAH